MYQNQNVINFYWRSAIRIYGYFVCNLPYSKRHPIVRVKLVYLSSKRVPKADLNYFFVVP